MNSDLDDPNNHVPPISPGDDWDDLDEVSEKSRMGLPPRKVDRGLPPKKEARSPRVNRYAPLLKLEQEEAYDPLNTKAGVTGAEEIAAENEAGDQGQPASSKIPGKRKRQQPGEKGKSTSAEEPDPGRLVLPPAQEPKRFRVNEIDPANDPLAARPARKAMKISSAVPEGGVDMEFAPKERRRFSRGERTNWGGCDARGSLRWMILTGLGVGLLVVLTVVMSQLPKGDKKGREDQSFYSQFAPTEDKPVNNSEDLKNLELLTNSQADAKGIFAAYACAKKPEEFMAYVHAPETNRGLIEKNWKPLGMNPGWAPGDDSLWTVLDKDGLRYAILEGLLGDFTGFKAYFRQEGDILQLDWKATVGYSSADFADMKKGNGDGSEVRAWISVADFYTFSFPEDDYRCFRIMSANGEQNLWGYVPIGSELDVEIQGFFLPSQITGESQNEIQVILGLAPGHSDALPDQWLITGVTRLSWLDD